MSGNTHAKNTITIGNTSFIKIVVNRAIMCCSSLGFIFSKEIGVWGKAPFIEVRVFGPQNDFVEQTFSWLIVDSCHGDHRLTNHFVVHITFDSFGINSRVSKPHNHSIFAFQSTHLCRCDNTVCGVPLHHVIYFDPRTLYKGTAAHSYAAVA